ncbi:MAG: hypothetical protein MUO26_01865, partial [Methanotrichaceae archaeon]|nr:hypothetical protein [Methanotrichaceae archaeon]
VRVAEKVRLNRQQVERIHDFAETFGTSAGKRVLEDLEKSFGGECYVRGDLYETLHRSSNRDLLVRIQTMIKMSEEGNIEIEEEEERDA